MSLVTWIRQKLLDPRLAGVDFDSDELVRVHRRILQEKRAVRDVFEEIYRTCRALDERFLDGGGARIEVGAGSSFLKERYPDIVSTDIKRADHLDRTLDAQRMDLPDQSVRAIYAINCFHHFPDPAAFFREVQRVAQPGGGCVLVDPYYGPFASWFFRRAFKTETFDRAQSQWTRDGGGVMVGANQALSYIVFVRDRRRFEQQFPALQIVYAAPLRCHLRYLCSGGVNFRPLVPEVLFPVLRGVEVALRPLRHAFALHHAIVLRRRHGPAGAADWGRSPAPR